MTDSALLVHSRQTKREIAQLGLSCNDHELPAFIDPDGTARRFVGLGRLGGSVRHLSNDGALGDTVVETVAGLLALCVDDRRVAGIVAPESEMEPAAWFCSEIANTSFETAGSAGVFKKRPEALIIEAPDFTFSIADASELFERSMQPRRVNELIKLLTH